MRVRAAAAALTLLVSLGAGACSSPARAPITVGAIYPLSGPQAEGGREELDGLRAALHVAQESGALGGREVRLQVVDVQTPDGAAGAVDRLIDQHHVSVIAGTYGSTLSEAAAARADQRHVVYWETGAVADDVTRGRSWVFRTVATGSDLGRTAVRFAAGVFLTGSSVRPPAAIVEVDDVYGRSVADAEAREAQQAGFDVVDRIRYNPASFDARAIAARLAAERPAFLFDVSYIDDGVAIWDAVRRAGLSFRAAVGTSSAFCMRAFSDRLGSEAVGVYAADKPDHAVNPAALSPSARALLARAESAWARLHGGEMTIPGVAGFVGGWTLFGEVLGKLGPDASPASIRTRALAVDVPVGDAINGGGVRFAPPGSPDAGQNLRAAAVVGQWQAVGRMVVVYPQAYAVGKPDLSLR